MTMSYLDPTPPDDVVRDAEPTPGQRIRRVLGRVATIGGLAVLLGFALAFGRMWTLETLPTGVPSVAALAPALGHEAVLPEYLDAAPQALGSAGLQRAVMASRVDPVWAESTSRATGIPVRAVIAYAGATLVIEREQPECGIGWNTLAGIGRIETGHGTFGGAALDDAGYPQPAIRGPALDGIDFASIPDTDGGAWDGDTVWDRAVGPMQFIPSTWASWGADGDGDGDANPNQIDDAALAAARYLCHSGPMTTTEGWRAAVFSYNHLESYVDSVAVAANEYAAAVEG